MVEALLLLLGTTRYCSICFLF